MRLAQRIDGRVGDLREALLAVVPQRPREAREKRGRSIVTHAPDRLLSFKNERLKEELVLIVGPAERCHDTLRLVRGGLRKPLGRDNVQWNGGVRRIPEFLPVPDLCGSRELTGARIAEQHLAGAQALALGDFLAVQVGDANLGTHNQQAVRSQRIAEGTQAVAIELGADGDAVGEDHGGGAVPRLLLRRVSFEEAAQVRGNLRVRLPRGRNHGEHARGAAVAPAQ